MLVTYNAPNRAHHYAYAQALAEANCLKAFVSGFSRFSPRDSSPKIGDRLIRSDLIQNLYLMGIKLRMPALITNELAYWSKCWIDRMSEAPARRSDIFLFYSGAGLQTAKRLYGSGVLRVVEAVNSHVLVQERILREEHQRIGRPFRQFHAREVVRRVREYETADAILCPSAFVRQSFVKENFPADRIFTVPYGMTLPLASPSNPPDDGAFRVLYVGQISVRKGLRYLFEAFAGLRHPKKELWIVGPVTPESGIRDITPPEGTRFFGVLKGDALAQAYQKSSVFVLPTIEDGLALVLGEALSYGLPVITTDHSGGTDLFQNGEEGFIVPIRSPAAIRERLQELADDPALHQRMSVAARARAGALRGWATTGQRLIEALTTVTRLSPR